MNTGDAVAVWKQSLELLSNINETKSPLAKVYLNYLVPISLDEQQFIFAVRLLQAKLWIEERYISYIRETISSVVKSPRDVVLVVDEMVDHSIDQGGASPSVQSSHQLSEQRTQTLDAQRMHTSSHSSQNLSVDSVETPSLQKTTPLLKSSASVVFNQQPLAQQNVSAHPLQHATNKPDIMSHENIPPDIAPPVVNHIEKHNLGTGLSSVFAPDIQTQNSTTAEEDSRFNFSNYVMGNSNEFAYKASLRVAEAPGLYFNPLFIYGRSGLGKTHLLLSIKNYIGSYLMNKRVVYAPTTEFVNDFTNAMAGDRDLTSFKRKYHTCDVLLIDDVQNLEGKEGTTDALFEIFNMFIDSKKQIVLSADRSPVEINLDERFTSRFAQGITADIQPPNYEMKSAILKNYIRYYCNFLNIQEVEFSDEAIQNIVELSGSNIRELEGAVSNLIVSVSCRPASKKNIPITYDDVGSVLGKSFFHKISRRVDSNTVMRAVESYFKVSHAELLSEKRSKNISYPRQVAMYLIRRYTDMSYPEIGDSFNKDHTTVMYADRNIQAKMVEEASVKHEVEHIAEMLTL